MGEYSPFFYANIFVTSLLALLALLIMSALNRTKMDRLSPKVQFINGVLDTAEFDSNLFNKALGSAIVGLTVWTYHWFVKVGSSAEEKSSKELEPQLG